MNRIAAETLRRAEKAIADKRCGLLVLLWCFT